MTTVIVFCSLIHFTTATALVSWGFPASHWQLYFSPMIESFQISCMHGILENLFFGIGETQIGSAYDNSRLCAYAFILHISVL